MINPRVDPSIDPSSRQIAQPYVLTPDRLRQIRTELLYPFYDQGKIKIMYGIFSILLKTL